MSASTKTVTMRWPDGKLRKSACLALAAFLGLFMVAIATDNALAPIDRTASPTTTAIVGQHQTYSVVGNEIVNSSGQPMVVHGVNRSSLENTCSGASVTGQETGIPANDFVAMRDSWNATIVRLPLDQHFWLSDCNGYRATVERTVQEIKANHMLVILDLHWWTDPSSLTFATTGQAMCMPNRNSLTFWRQVAVMYKHDPDVWFELYNEPNPTGPTLTAQWNMWLNGGSVSCANNYTGLPMSAFAAVGMQQLVQTIRATGAQNIVLADGIERAYTLRGAPLLSGGNIAYAVHPYLLPTEIGTHWGTNNWDERFGELASKVPVVATEFGDYECGNSNESRAYEQEILGYFRERNISYLAWDWFAKYGCDVPELITDASGHCRERMGCTIQRAMESYQTVSLEGVSLDRLSVTVHGGRDAEIRLTCEEATACRGKVVLRIKATSKGVGALTSESGGTVFSIAPDKTRSLKIQLSKDKRSFFRKATLMIIRLSPGPSRVMRAEVELIHS